MKIIFNLFLVLCQTAWLFQGRHLIGRLEWRPVILHLVGSWFHCRSRTVSDMTCKLGITFADESKDFYVEKSGQSSCRRAKRFWLVEVRRRTQFQLEGNCLLRSSLHQYKTIVQQRQVSFPATSTHTREPCDTLIWIQPWTRNEKIGSNINVWPPNIWILKRRSTNVGTPLTIAGLQCHATQNRSKSKSKPFDR